MICKMIRVTSVYLRELWNRLNKIGKISVKCLEHRRHLLHVHFHPFPQVSGFLTVYWQVTENHETSTLRQRYEGVGITSKQHMPSYTACWNNLLTIFDQPYQLKLEIQPFYSFIPLVIL